MMPVCDGSGGGTVERFDNASALVRSLTYRRHMRSAPQASHADQLSAVSADRRVSHVSGGQWRQPRGQLRAAAVKLYWLCSRVQTCLSIRRQSPPASPRPAQQLPALLAACFTRPP